MRIICLKHGSQKVRKTELKLGASFRTIHNFNPNGESNSQKLNTYMMNISAIYKKNVILCRIS